MFACGFLNVIPNAIGHLQAEFINTKFYLMLEQQEFTENNWKKKEKEKKMDHLTLFTENPSSKSSYEFSKNIGLMVIQGKREQW